MVKPLARTGTHKQPGQQMPRDLVLVLQLRRAPLISQRIQLVKHQDLRNIGSATINADRGQISLGVGGVTFVITAGGIDMQGGQVTHNGKNIGSDHAHSGIQRGSANSDGPI